MRHPTEGVLRRLIDEPAGVADPEREHVAGCRWCLDRLATAREDAALVGAALAGPIPVTGITVRSGDVDAAWKRLAVAARDTGPGRVTRPSVAGRRQPSLRRPVVAALAAAAVLTGAGAAAANDWLPIFRTEQIEPVRLSTADLVALPDLSSYGDVTVTDEPDLHEVPDASAAEAATGLEVPEVSALPHGVSGAATYQVGGTVSATFTFSHDRAARAAAEAGETLPPVPAGLDGSRLRLVAGPGVAQTWESSAGIPALVVGRAVAPTAFSSGVDFETARDYLLSLPGLPEDVAAQLRTFTADGSTLPLPVPGDEVTTSAEEVNGVPATVVATRDRTLAGVVWVDDGVVTAVAGSLDADEVLSVARGLR